MRDAVSLEEPRFALPRWTRGLRDQGGVLLVGLILGILIGTLVVDPNRRLIVFLVGIAFSAAVYATPSVLSLAVLALVLPFGVKITVGNTNVVFILLLAVVVLLRSVREHARLDSGSRVWAPMLLLMVMHMLSMINTDAGTRAPSLVKLAGLASAMLLCFLIVAAVRDVPTLKLVTIASVAGCALTCVLASYELTHPGHAILPRFFYAPWSSRSGGVRAVGTFGNYSNYAQYLAMNLTIMSFLFLRASRGLTRAVLLFLIAWAGAIFLSSGMRGAFVALLLAAVYLSVFARHAVRLGELGGVVLMMAGLLSTAAIALTTLLHVRTLFGRIALLGLTGGSATARAAIAHAMLGRLREHLLIGHGPAIQLPETYQVVTSTNNPHDQYLYYLYTVGILGLLAFLIFAATLVTEGHVTLVRTRKSDPFALGLLAILQANLVLFLFHELFDDYMFSPLSMQTTWFYFGLLLATARLVRKEAAALAPAAPARAPAALTRVRPAGAAS